MIIRQHRYFVKEYITLEEFINLWYNDNVIDDNYISSILGIVKNNIWKYQTLYDFLTKDNTADSTQVSIFSHYPFIKYDTDTSQYYSTAIVNKLFDYIRQRYQKSLLVYPIVKNEPFNTKAFINTFISILINTYEKYELILSQFESQKDNLLSGITISHDETFEGSGKNRFNDTPQTKEVNGETFIDEDYTSSINLNDSSSERIATTEDDRELLVQRLNRVEREMDTIYLTWSREFMRLFK